MHPRSRPIACSAVLMIALIFSFGCAGTTNPPNIVLIYVDDLGWRDVGFMGSTYYETPHIDRLAEAGVVFTQAYANAPNCAPSRASLLTGQYTPRHGIYTVGSPERGQAHLRKLIPTPNTTALDTGFVTLAEALKAAGYATAHVGKWHLGGDGHLPTNQGFDVNVAGDDKGYPASYFYPYERGAHAVPGLQEAGHDGEYLTDRLTDEALGFIETHTGQPFFLYFAHYAVHTPLQAKETIIEGYRRKPGDPAHNNPTYAAMIASVDESTGRVLDKLDAQGLTDNTIVVFFSDNGGYGPATSMTPLRGSKGMLYEGGIRVPLAVYAPRLLPEARRDDTPVIGTDLYPTLLALAGVPLPPGQPHDGVSLRPLLLDATPPAPRTLHWHFPAYLERYRDTPGPWRTTPAAAIRQGDFKLIEFFEDNRLELYNLRTDPGEQNNLTESMPDKTQQLHALMQSWREDVQAPVPSEANPEYDPNVSK